MLVVRKAGWVALFLAILISGFVTGVSAQERGKDYSIGDHEVLTPPKNEDESYKHWLFVECDHWAGCYMPCKGTLKQCLNIAHKANWTVISVHSRVEKEPLE